MSDDRIDQPSAPAPTPAERTALAALPAAGLFLLFLGGQLLIAPALQLANVAFGLVFVGVFVLAAPPTLFLRAANLSPRAFLRLLPATPKQVGLGFAIGAANFLVAGILQFAVRRVLPESWLEKFDSSHIFRDAGPLELAAIVFAVGVSAPIVEEIAFRGYLQTAFRGRRSDYGAVLVTAILFSLLHLDPVGFLARVELGALFGLLALWSGSLLPAIAAHMANNLLASTLLIAAVSSESPEPAAEPNFLFVLGGAALSAVATLQLLRSFRASRPHPAATEPFLVSLDPDADHRMRIARIARPLLLTFSLAIASLGLFVALDWRGIRVALVADTLLPHAEIRERLPDDIEDETLARLRRARRSARRGEASFDSYFELRKALAGPALKPGETRTLLTQEEIEAAFARFEGRAPAETSVGAAPDAAAESDEPSEELVPTPPLPAAPPSTEPDR